MDELKRLNGKENEKEQSGATSFFIKTRFIFLGLIIALVVFAIAFGVISSVKEKSLKSDFAKYDAIEYSLIEAEKNSADSELDTKRNEILKTAKELTDVSSDVAMRNDILQADILFAQKSWKDARDSYISASEKTSSYLKEIALYNAGVCSEELKDYAEAKNYYLSVIDLDGSIVPEALFSLARIEYQNKEFENAKTHFQTIIDKYSTSDFINLSKSMVIAIETQAN